MSNKIIDLRRRYQSQRLEKKEFIRQALAEHIGLFDYVDVTKETDVKKIIISERGVCFHIADADMQLYAPVAESRVAPIEIMNFSSYEKDETFWVDQVAEKSQVVLDIGANIGFYAIRFARRNPLARVFAFEPIPASYDFLGRNVAINDLDGRVACFNYGLSNQAGAFEFFICPEGGTNASLRNVSGAANAVGVTCLTMTLDQWMSNHPEVFPDFIKCDVEGAELLVFQGGINSLSKHLPIVFSELLRKWSKPFGYHPNDVLAFFGAIGYAAYAISAAGLRAITQVDEATIETNYLFLHKEKHASIIAGLGGA